MPTATTRIWIRYSYSLRKTVFLMIHAWPRLFTRSKGIWNPCSCNDMRWSVWRYIAKQLSLVDWMGDLGVVVWMMNHLVLFFMNHMKQVMRNSPACFHSWYRLVISHFHLHSCDMIHLLSIEESYCFHRKPNESCQLDPSWFFLWKRQECTTQRHEATLPSFQGAGMRHSPPA